MFLGAKQRSARFLRGNPNHMNVSMNEIKSVALQESKFYVQRLYFASVPRAKLPTQYATGIVYKAWFEKLHSCAMSAIFNHDEKQL